MRSEVQVLPGPPAFAARAASVGEPTGEARRLSAVARLRAKADGADGAIAQLGERVLCKHEVVGSIPSGSTSRTRRVGFYPSGVLCPPFSDPESGRFASMRSSVRSRLARPVGERTREIGGRIAAEAAVLAKALRACPI